MKKFYSRKRNLKEVICDNAHEREIGRAVKSVTDEDYKRVWGKSIDEHVKELSDHFDRLLYLHSPEGRLLTAIMENPRLREGLLQRAGRDKR